MMRYTVYYAFSMQWRGDTKLMFPRLTHSHIVALIHKILLLDRKEMGLNVQEIPFRWIWLQICILMYFEVLNNV
jgi:hypothetical protein